MPKITINEIDLTTGGSLNATSNIVYVPGLAEKLPEDYEFGKPRLYETLSDFQTDFGTKVPIIKEKTSSGLSFFDGDKAYDPGFIYATELLRLGMPVLFDCLLNSPDTTKKIVLGDSTVLSSKVIEVLDTRLKDASLRDKGLYNIKFISTGGYAHSQINASINALAEARNDCCAIQYIVRATTFDAISKATANPTALSNIKLSVSRSPAGKCSAAFIPWGIYEVPCIQNYIDNSKTTLDGKYGYYPNTVELPASFGYLMAAANCFATGLNNWAAIAGASRGTIPYLKSLNEHYTEEQINTYLQTRDKIAINPIATINPFGDIIWGNRTLFNNTVNGDLTASSFLNIRNLISDVKKTVFRAARQMTFEQNSAILWVKFKSLIKPTLDQIVSGSGLSGYELIKKVTKDKAKLVATVRLFAIEAVEDFDITIELADDTAAITE